MYEKSGPSSIQTPDRPSRIVQLKWLIYPGRPVPKPRRIFRPFNLGPIGCSETSVTLCITTQKSAQLEEALYRNLWKTRFGRGCVTVAKTDYAQNRSSKISPQSDQALTAPVHYALRLQDRHLRHRTGHFFQVINKQQFFFRNCLHLYRT
jgi:hypothetical protein